MASYTITTTAEQEAALTRKRQAEAPEATDNAEYVTGVAVPALVQAALQVHIEARLQRVADAYRAGTAAQRTAVDRALGL